MQQVLFRIPIPGTETSIPIYGFGGMVVVAIFLNLWLMRRRAEREGIARDRIYDLAIWVIVAGFIGARIVYMIQYGVPFSQFYRVWEGGLVWYGGAVGGWVGYALAYWFVVRKYGLNTWQIADVVAPSVALGLCIGRIGCLLNGCCFGNLACPECPAIHFPMRSLPWEEYTRRGYQTPAGFTLADSDAQHRTVGVVDPHAPAAAAGLKAGDVIVAIDRKPIESYFDLSMALFRHDAKELKHDVQLTVRRNEAETELPAFRPVSVPLHPTQIYETLSMGLLSLLLLAFTPYRQHYGQVMVLFLSCYAVHRFLNEVLRNDTDPVAFGMTLSQNGSIVIFLAAMALEAYLWRRQPRLAAQG